MTNGTVCNGSLPFTAYSNLTFAEDSDNGKRVCYRAIDSLGNFAFKLSAPIEGIRTKKPVISIVGSPALVLDVGRHYTDGGATAKDGYGNDLTGMVLARGEVDTRKLGDYAVTYTVTDSAGNSAEPAIRKVKVVDRIAPVISLLGNASIRVQKGWNYTDDGASALDNYDGDLTGKIAVQNFVDTEKPGTYFVAYSVTDSSGNAATERRQVEVEESVLVSFGYVIAGLAVLAVLGAAGVGVYMIVLRKRRGL